MHVLRSTISGLLVLMLAALVVGCPASRRGGDDDDAGDDDDNADINGALAWWTDQYGYDVLSARLAFRAGGELSCAEWVGADLDYEELEGTWVTLYLYRGGEAGWEGTYDLGGTCGSGVEPDMQCVWMYSSDGSEVFDHHDHEMTISSWSSDRVEGRVESDDAGLDESFVVDNCGEYSWDTRDATRTEPEEPPSTPWRLRLR